MWISVQQKKPWKVNAAFHSPITKTSKNCKDVNGYQLLLINAMVSAIKFTVKFFLLTKTRLFNIFFQRYS